MLNTYLVQVQNTISDIRQAQVKLFNEHLELESHPGDGIDMLGALDPGSADDTVGENHFKPLETWFDGKEHSVQTLTLHLEEICQKMAILNEISNIPKEFER